MIWRYWTGPELPPLAGAYAGLILAKLHSPVTDLDDGDLADWQPWLNDHASQVIDAYRLRHRANMVRWRLLAERGGVWLDHDVIPLGALPIEPAWTAAYGTHRCSCAMAFPAGHPVPARMIEQIDAYDGPPRRSMDVSGDNVLDRVSTPDVASHRLPFDGTGRRDPAAALWCVHTWHSRTATRYPPRLGHHR